MAKQKKNNLSTRVVSRTEYVYNNTLEDIIQINDSKARLIYRDYIEKRSGKGLFFTYLGLFLTCFLAALTSSFNDFLGIPNSRYVLYVIFWLGTVSFFILTVFSLFVWLKNRKKYNEDNFIAFLKDDRNKKC